MLGNFLFFMRDILWDWCNQSHKEHEMNDFTVGDVTPKKKGQQL